MKIKELALLPAIMAICSCSAWKADEENAINGSAGIMPVMCIDDPAGQEVLRRSCDDISPRAIKTPTYETLCRRMISTVTDTSQNGVGIAGPQVGISRRIVAVQRFDKEGEPWEVYPNIRIIEMRGPEVYGPEGCLSLPGRYGEVRRSRDITVGYTSPATLRDTSETVQGFTAVIFQHECDHLDGTVFTDRIWEDKNSWNNNTATFPADIFYLVSTNVVASFDSTGKESFNAVLNPAEKEAIDHELDFVREQMSGDSLNFFSPYYHQATMSGILKQDIACLEFARLEVLDAFDHYIKHINNGRPFILAGFSQGAAMAVEILKHMDDAAYSRMLAAYIIGYGISPEDSACPHIRPAGGPFEKGSCISFNTVKDTSGIWPAVYNRSICCINPANWRVDATPASFDYCNQTITAAIDTSRNVIIASGYDGPSLSSYSENCLHVGDLLFYAPFLRRNALDRVYKDASGLQ